jgi:hypothetical protein
MSFDWLGYLDLAKELNDSLTFNTEAKQRSAVSRAYYAVFNLAKPILNKWKVIRFLEQQMPIAT